jgi:hypothetical protein
MPVFAGHAERCTAEPGSFQTLEFGTVPHHTISAFTRVFDALLGVLRRARDKHEMQASETHRPGRDREDSDHQHYKGQWIIVRPKAATQLHDSPPG